MSTIKSLKTLKNRVITSQEAREVQRNQLDAKLTRTRSTKEAINCIQSTIIKHTTRMQTLKNEFTHTIHYKIKQIQITSRPFE